MATMNISLPDPMRAWVETRLEGGRFSNVSDYIRELIRRDQERQDALATLQAAIDEGLSSGPPEAFELVDFKAQMRARRDTK